MFLTQNDFVFIELSIFAWAGGWERVEKQKEYARLHSLKNARGLNFPIKESLELTNRIMAEEAVREYYGLSCIEVPFCNRITLGDLPSINTDVKSINKLFLGNKPMSLIVHPSHLILKRRYILVLWENEELPFFKLLGWDSGDRVKTFQMRDPKNKDGTPRNDPAYFEPWTNLQPMRNFQK